MKVLNSPIDLETNDGPLLSFVRQKRPDTHPFLYMQDTFRGLDWTHTSYLNSIDVQYSQSSFYNCSNDRVLVTSVSLDLSSLQFDEAFLNRHWVSYVLRVIFLFFEYHLLMIGILIFHSRSSQSTMLCTFLLLRLSIFITLLEFLRLLFIQSSSVLFVQFYYPKNFSFVS